MSLPEDLQAELGHVTYIEGTDDPNWWRTREMTSEEIEQRRTLWHRYWGHDLMSHILERLASIEGGGFTGPGITDGQEFDWPRKVLIYLPPLKGYWSELRKQRALQTLDQIYVDIKREIEDA